jgi:putative DNA primase/helicase
VILTERGVDAHRETQLVTLAWLADGRWQHRAIDRAVVASTRSVVDLAAYGIPVTSNNAKAFVQYIADFEAANLGTLPVVTVARQLG